MKKFKEFVNENINNSNERMFISCLRITDRPEDTPIFYKGFFVIDGQKVKGEEVRKERLHSMAENGNCFYVPIMISDDEIKTNDKYVDVDSEYEGGNYDHIWMADHEESIHSVNDNDNCFKLTSNEESVEVRDAYLSGKIEASNDVEFENYTREWELEYNKEIFD